MHSKSIPATGFLLLEATAVFFFIHLCILHECRPQAAGEIIPLIVTTGGKEFRDCKIKRVDPDGLFIENSGGLRKIKFTDLPAEWQKKFGFNAEQAVAFEKAVAEKQRALQLSESEKSRVLSGKITGHFEMQDSKPLNIALSELFRSTHAAHGTGTAIVMRQETRTTRTTNAVGGEGLPIVETFTIEEKRDLGRFLIVGNETDFHDEAGRNQTIFPIERSKEFFRLDEPVFAFSPDAAVAASYALADIGRKRSVPFTEKRIIGQTVEAVVTQYDPFMRRSMSVQNGRLVEREYAPAPETMAVVTLDYRPGALLTIALLNQGKFDTLWYQTLGGAPPLSEAEILTLLTNSTGSMFEEIISPGEIEIVDENGAGFIDNWFEKTEVTKAYWSSDAKYLVLAVPDLGGNGGYKGVWVTSRLEKLLGEVKMKNPPELWWSQVNGALSENPPSTYNTTFPAGTGIEDY